jgi:segregation and condensation protein B
MNQLEWIKVMEGLLFASESPISLERLHEILAPGGLDRQAVKKVIADLAESLERADRAIQVIEVAGGYRLVTRKDLGPWIKKLSRPRKIRLSPASLETLAIIAYKQPTTCPEVESIRGVNSSGVLKTLIERGLIKIAGRMDAVGNPIMYATTREFLEYFGLRSLKDLPTLQEFQEIMEEQEHKQEEENVEPGSEGDEPNGKPEEEEKETYDTEPQSFEALEQGATGEEREEPLQEDLH